MVSPSVPASELPDASDWLAGRKLDPTPDFHSERLPFTIPDAAGEDFIRFGVFLRRAVTFSEH